MLPDANPLPTPPQHELDAAKATLHTIVDEAFDKESSTRLVALVADAEGVSMHAIGVDASEFAQIMEAAYARYQERFYRSTPEVLQ